MKRSMRLTESVMRRLVNRVLREQNEDENMTSYSKELAKVDDYITDNGKQKPQGDYALIYRVIHAAYDQKFHPSVLLDYLYKNLKNPSV